MFCLEIVFGVDRILGSFCELAFEMFFASTLDKGTVLELKINCCFYGQPFHENVLRN